MAKTFAPPTLDNVWKVLTTDLDGNGPIDPRADKTTGAAGTLDEKRTVIRAVILFGVEDFEGDHLNNPVVWGKGHRQEIEESEVELVFDGNDLVASPLVFENWWIREGGQLLANGS